VAAGGLTPVARTKASAALKKATKSVRKLAMPVAGVVAKSVFKKISGVDVSDLTDAVTGSAKATAASPHDPIKVEDLLPVEKANAVLDKLFTVQLSEHAQRKQSIADLKEELGTVLKVLGSRAGYSAPMFIVIDELDRCKPSFAVGLLEAIKHIFGIPGICVVVATNMDQLAHTVKAVYGEGFDARTYLQRFFNAIYTMPTAVGPQLLQLMLKERPVFSDRRRCKWALPRHDFIQDDYGTSFAGMLAWIFDGLRLPLRSQDQVLEVMEAVALGVSAEKEIHVPWLAIVCGLWHSHRTAFYELERISRTGGTGDEVWKQLGFDGVQRKYFQPSDYSNRSDDQPVSLRDLGAAYCSRANQNMTELRARLHSDSRGFSSIVEHELAAGAPHTFDPSKHYSSGLLECFELVRTAGHFEPSTPT